MRTIYGLIRSFNSKQFSFHARAINKLLKREAGGRLLTRLLTTRDRDSPLNVSEPPEQRDRRPTGHKPGHDQDPKSGFSGIERWTGHS